MKPIHSILILQFAGICTFASLSAQGVNPQNLFDTGINTGYLVGHVNKGSDQAEAPTWAGNAAAEWLSSFEPGRVNPITPDLQNPNLSHQEMLNALRSMPSCSNPYVTLRLSLYQLGHNLGLAIVETGYDCATCLKTEMQKTSIAMRTIGNLLRSQAWQNLSQELNEQTLGLNTSLTGTLAAQQNSGQFGYLKSVLDQVNTLLPDDLLLCNDNQEEPEAQAEPTQTPPQQKSPNRKKKNEIILTGGLTAASLHGELGTVSLVGNGFYGGFDLLRGAPFFFMTGVDFFRNSAGSEYFNPSTGQIADPGEYIQGFRLSGGLGYHIIRSGSVSLNLHAKARLLLATAIDGNLSSIGRVLIEENPVHVNVGSYLSISFFSIHLSVEYGLTPAISLDGEGMDYRMVNVGVGAKF